MTVETTDFGNSLSLQWLVFIASNTTLLRLTVSSDVWLLVLHHTEGVLVKWCLVS
jgi:hypothetical protein